MKFEEMPYIRVDQEQFNRQADKLRKKLENAASAQEQLAAYREMDELIVQTETPFSLCYVRNTINTQDAFYAEEQEHNNRIAPILDQKRLEFYLTLLSSPFRKELEAELGELFFLNLELEQKSMLPEIIPLVQEENSLCTRYQALIASAQIEFHGKKCTIPQLLPYITSPDRQVRRDAYLARAKFYQAHQTELESIADSLIQNRTEQARRLGMKDYVELGYLRRMRNCYGPKEVAGFREQALRDIVPVVRHLKEDQAKRIGVTDFKAWDDPIEFPDGNAIPKGNPKELLERTRQMYTEMSPQTAEFIQLMLDCNLFDVEAKEGKANTGYCTSFPAFQCPFVFANFSGTSDDVRVLTHEAGHAFASYIADRQIKHFNNRQPSMEGCESHSMSMEFLTIPWYHLFFQDQAKKYEISQLEGALSFIPYGCMGDHFQEIIYSNPGMTPAERNEAWKKLDAQYRPYLDYGDLPFYRDGAAWLSVIHIFCYPFYYVDYSLAQTISLQVWAESQKDWQSAWDRYYKFVQMGGTKNFLELVESAGFVSPMKDGSLRAVANAVEDWRKKN